LSDFEAYSVNHIVSGDDWNYLLDHGLEKPVTYIIRKNGNYYEAIDGSSGKIVYGGSKNRGGVDGSSKTAVFNACKAALGTGQGTILDKDSHALYGFNSGAEVYYRPFTVSLIPTLRNVQKLMWMKKAKLKQARLEGYSLSAGETKTLLNLSESGVILGVWLATHNDAVLKIYFDDEASPNIETDVGSFGTHYADNRPDSYGTEHIQVAGNALTYYSSVAILFPMPFDSVRIDAYNPTGGSFDLYAQIFYTTSFTLPYRLRGNAVTWQNKVQVSPGGSYEFLNVSGKAGWLVWHSMVIYPVSASWNPLEADIEVYVDGESSPSIKSTGTEDWFLSSWYFIYGQTTDTPHAFLAGVNPTLGIVSAGIDLLSAFGGIRFDSGLQLKWDYSEPTVAADISYIVLYYEET